MYDELIANLRNCAEVNSLSRYKRDLMKQAADAIEELQGKAKVLEKLADKWCEAVPKWIPVTERLPKGADKSGELCENVWLLFDDGNVYPGWMNGITEKVYYLDNYNDFIMESPISRVKMWQPKPEPPKGD